MELNDVLLEIKEFSLQPSKWNRRSTGKKLLTPLTFYFFSLPLSPSRLESERTGCKKRTREFNEKWPKRFYLLIPALRPPGPRKTSMLLWKRTVSPARNRPLGRPSGKWGTILNGVHWSHRPVAATVNTVVNIWFAYKAGNFCARWPTVSLSRTLFCGRPKRLCRRFIFVLLSKNWGSFSF